MTGGGGGRGGAGSGPATARRPLRLTVSGAAELVVKLQSGAEGDEDARPDFDPSLLTQQPAQVAAGRRRLEVVIDSWRFEVIAEDAAAAALRDRAVRAAAAHGVSARLAVRAQIPGRVTRLWVAAGEQVEAGQRLLAVEAMKMENEIRAPRAGTVESVAVGEGDRVELNDELLALA